MEITIPIFVFKLRQQRLLYYSLTAHIGVVSLRLCYLIGFCCRRKVYSCAIAQRTIYEGNKRIYILSYVISNFTSFGTSVTYRYTYCTRSLTWLNKHWKFYG